MYAFNLASTWGSDTIFNRLILVIATTVPAAGELPPEPSPPIGDNSIAVDLDADDDVFVIDT
jgi:hypothetical protein